MTSRAYTVTDYGACRYVLENPGAVVGTPLSLSIAVVQRLKLLNLVDGVAESTSTGEVVHLAGLGVKTAREAQRLGIVAVSAASTGGLSNPQKQQPIASADDC